MTQAIPQDQLNDLMKAKRTTLMALEKIDDQMLLQLTELTLPEIQAIQQEVADLLPAGNLPAMILSGLTQLKGRKLTAKKVRQDVKALLNGIELLPQGLFSIFIAGPATILHVYQKLLKLAGKDIDTAFPQGTWQFYLEFGLREDTARHANETVGFEEAHPHADPALAATAWILAALDVLYRYDDLLSTDWRERVLLRTLYEQAQEAGMAEQPLFAGLVRDWNRARPYHVPPAVQSALSPLADYLRHRLEIFEAFVQERQQALPPGHREQFRQRFQQRWREEQPPYLEQMTLLAALTPDQHQETKEAIPLWNAAVGFISHGQTTLIPACQRDAQGSPLCFPPEPDAPPVPIYAHEEGVCDAQGNVLYADRGGRVWHKERREMLGTLRPPTPEQVQAWVRSMLALPPEGEDTSPLDKMLVACPRATQAQLREKLPVSSRKEIAKLRRAPILINWDQRERGQPLASIRRGRRGIGDHALTLFRTGQSTVFDQSHIFFDGMWGLAVAEIMTDLAARTYDALEAIEARAPVTPLQLTDGAAEIADLVTKHRTLPDASAESHGLAGKGVNLENISRLRKWLKQRGVRLTVNDVLLLYFSFPAARYERLTERMQSTLNALEDRINPQDMRTVRQAIELALDRFRKTNPALLIPMDASNVAPRERLYPTTFRNPLTDLPAVFQQCAEDYETYRQSRAPEAWKTFDRSRRELLAYLKAFGEFMDTLKAVTMRGESFNTATLRLLGHLPPAMQNLLDQIPQRISVLNEVVKGNAVFSNVGRVAAGTSVRRFISAKDDGETKELVWGVLTDDRGHMHLSLRDFRPFSQTLIGLGHFDTAQRLAQDTLDSYVDGLNAFVAELSTIAAVKG